MYSPGSAALPVPGFESSVSLARAHTDEDVTPGEIAVGVIIGRSSEYFDFFVFGIASVLVFPSLLFPFLSRLDGTLMAFAIFALAFVARPVGTAISMAVQRRWGRGTKLTLALFLLGACTAGMAFLPSYASVGSTAIVALVILRIGQGLALGGTWDGLPSLLAMSAPQERRGWFAMIGQLGAPVGFVLAASLFAYLYGSLSTAEFLDWGWRYPFFVAFAINVVALFARLRLVVGQSYAELLQQRELQPVSVSQVVRDEGGNVLIGAFAALASFALFHLATVFPLSWIVMYSEQSITEVLSVQIVGAFLAAGAIMLSGWLAGRPDRAAQSAGLDGGVDWSVQLCGALAAGRRVCGQQRVLAGRFCAVGVVVRAGLGHRHGQFLRPVPLHGRGLVGRPGLAAGRRFCAAGGAGAVGQVWPGRRVGVLAVGCGVYLGGFAHQPLD